MPAKGATIYMESLPLKMNIKRRNIDLDTRCPVRNRFDEDGGHCFLKCKGVRQCWRELDLEGFRVQLLESANSREFVGEILNLNPHKCATIFCYYGGGGICAIK
jgi:hypothetical protein